MTARTLNRLAAATAVAFLAPTSACASSGAPSQPVGGSSAAPGISSASSPAPVVDANQRLAQPFTYRSGLLRFEPPNQNETPAITANEAVTIATSADRDLAGRTPEVFLAQFYSYDRSTTTDDSGHLVPDALSGLSWAVRYTQVPVTPDGGTSNKPSLEDALIVVNANSGTLIGLYNSEPDATPAPAPSAPMH